MRKIVILLSLLFAVIVLTLPLKSHAQCDNNLITNGDFEDGNVGFSTDYQSAGNMQAPGRVPPSRRSTQLGSPQGGTSLYGDVLEYLKRQGKDAPQRISPEGIDGIARPFMPSGGGSFNPGGGAINTPMPARSQITDAEVIPITIPPRVKITPAPINPIPVMIWPIILVGSISLLWTNCIAETKTYVPKHMRMLVRIPAGLSES